LLGRPDDVGEQHGGKDAIAVLRRLPGSHLLLRPGEGLHVLARGGSIRWPIGEHGDAGLEGPSDASGNLCPVDDFAEPAIVGVAVPPGDVAADHAGLLVVAGMVGAVQGEVAQRLELSLDPVQP
jgi:hypothetical protein